MKALAMFESQLRVFDCESNREAEIMLRCRPMLVSIVLAVVVTITVVLPISAGVRHASGHADIHNYYGFVCASSDCSNTRGSVMPWCKVPLVEWHLSYMCSYERSYKHCLERVSDECLDAANGAGMVGVTGGAASAAIGAAAGSGPVGWASLAGGAGVGAVSWVTAYYWCHFLSSVASQGRADCLSDWNQDRALQERAFSVAERYYREQDRDWDGDGACDECFQ